MTLTLLALLLLIYIPFRLILLHSFVRFEEQMVLDESEEILHALSNHLDALDTTTLLYSMWDDTYAFVQHPTDQYVENNFYNAVFPQLQIHLLVLVNTTGDVVFAKDVEWEALATRSVTADLLQQLQPDAPLLHHTSPESRKLGILLLDTGPLLVASRPILTSQGSVPIRGSLIMGRYLDATEIATLTRLTGNPFAVYRLDAVHLPADVQQARLHLSNTTPLYAHELNEQITIGYILVKDVYDIPALVLCTTFPRSIYLQGVTMLFYFTLAMVIAGLIVGLMCLLLLDKLVLVRLKHLSNSVISIGNQGDFSARIPWPPQPAGMGDELTRLAHAINDMLFALQQAEAVRLREERYMLAARGANDGLWDWNLQTNELYFSSRWKEMLGYEEHELDSTPDEWFNRVHPDDLPFLRELLTAHLEQRTAHFEHEHRMLHRDGSWCWMLSRGLAVRTAAGQAIRMAGSQTDVTDRKVAEDQLLHTALHDALTGLPNRLLFADRMQRAIECDRQSRNSSFAVLLLDIDHFKTINDSLGHLIGDQLLVSMAHRIQSCLRDSDIIARLGGDEFALLLEPISDLSDAASIAQRILQALTIPFQLGERELFVSVSIGITLSSHGYTASSDLLRDADAALYQAKARGRACYAVFNPELHTQALARLEVATALRRAIEHNELRVYYQPIVTLATRQIMGFEALVRWQHPQRGLLLPGEFLLVAEETGLDVAIDRWVLREAAHQVQCWQLTFKPEHLFTISVNLSARQLVQPDLATYIQHILQETGLLPQQLRLEITEHAMMQHIEAAIAALECLRAMQVDISLDDFGVGHSSLTYLRRLPLSNLKIDRSFIAAIGNEQHNAAIIAAIVGVAHTLGMDVVAEGAETTEHLQLLRRLNCEYAQGFIFSPPVEETVAATLLANEPAWFAHLWIDTQVERLLVC